MCLALQTWAKYSFKLTEIAAQNVLSIADLGKIFIQELLFQASIHDCKAKC
jgi:hypothetical protein